MDAELRGMVMAYRVTELQALLAFAGKNKQGRKNELQARALELVRAKTPQVVLKMRELYRSLQMTHYGQPMSLTAGNSGATASSMVSSRYDNPSSYYSSSGYKGQEGTFSRSTLQSIGYQRVVSTDGQYRSVPICPDVKLKELPFYDIHSVLIRPTTLINQGHMPKQETQNSFCLTPSQAAEIASSKEIVPSDGVQNSRMQFNVQVQLRFCALDSEGEQDDQFPQSLLVKVNGRNIQLPHPIPSNRPGVEPKRPSKPLNITNSVKCSPTVTNVITVQWVADSTKNFAMSVNIVKRLTAEELFLRLKSKRIQPADYTRGRIKEITSAEEEDLCAPTSIRVSVACPLGKNRMAYPCRGTSCKHLQCFDANLFLLMNEKKPTFICPVCNKALKFDELSIDGYFMDVIKELSIDDGNDIELYPDGRWEPAVKVKKEIEDVGPPPKRLKKDDGSSAAPSLNTTIDLDDDILLVEDDAPSTGPSTSTASSSSKNNSGKTAEPEVVDLIDSSDEEETETETRMSAGSRSETMTPTLARESSETPQAKDAEPDDDGSDDDEVGVRRPRRRATKVNYIEDSSSDSSTTNEGTTTVVQTNTNARRPRSPACIELSDSAPSSPEPPQRQPRAFAAVSSHSSSRSTSGSSSHPNNNRSGSGSSTLYSSSTTAPTTTMPTPTGIGLPSSPMDPVSSPHLLNPSPNTFSYTSTSSQSASLFSNTPAPPTLPSPSSSSLYFSTTSSTVPGYTAYDARSWEADLNSFINVQQQMSYGQMNLTSYDYMNPTSQQQQHPSNFSGFGPRPPGGAGPGGGYPGWL